jgi:hypothetical protein
MTKYLIALATFAALVTGTVLAKAQAQAKPAVVRGAWQVSMDGQGHGASVLQTLALQQTGATISGTLQAPQGGAVPVRGTVTGQNISFSVKRHTPDGDVTQEFAGTVNGDSIKGTVTQGQFHVDWSAARPKSQTKQTAQSAQNH